MRKNKCWWLKCASCEFVMSASGFEVARGKFQDEKRKYAKAIHLIVIVISALRIIYYNSYNNNNNNNSKKSIFIIDFEVRWCVCVNFFVFSLHVSCVHHQNVDSSFFILYHEMYMQNQHRILLYEISFSLFSF